MEKHDLLEEMAVSARQLAMLLSMGNLVTARQVAGILKSEIEELEVILSQEDPK